MIMCNSTNKINNQIYMYYTPRINRKDTQTTHFSSNLSTFYKKSTFGTKKDSLNSTAQIEPRSNRGIQKINKIALPINVSKQKVTSVDSKRNNSPIRANPAKYHINVISKMSSQGHGPIVAYGISTYKGFSNITNPHFLSVNLGQIKNIMLAQSFDGCTAAKLIRQKFPLALIDLSFQKEQLKPQQIIYQAFNQIQKQIMSKQLQLNDNSGACFISVVIHNDIVMVANAGSTQAVCYTKNGLFLKLSNMHTTCNANQMDRIIGHGGTVYQTVVNVPYQKQLQIKGPMRLSPCGLIYTRCLGRTLDYVELCKKQNKPIQNLYNQQDQPQNLTWRPEIKYLKASDISWLGLFSEAIINNCSFEYIKQCVTTQMKKKSQTYTEHHIAKQISNKIVTQMANKGIVDALSAIILFLSPIDFNQNSDYVFQTRKQFKINSLKKQKVLKKSGPGNTSLTYLGNRRSFVKQVDSDCKKYSLTKIQKTQQNQRQIKRQFSFNKNN